MIVCSCNVLSDKQIAAAVLSEPCPARLSQIYACLSAASARRPSSESARTSEHHAKPPRLPIRSTSGLEADASATPASKPEV
jgi:hypothetical protein